MQAGPPTYSLGMALFKYVPSECAVIYAGTQGKDERKTDKDGTVEYSMLRT